MATRPARQFVEFSSEFVDGRVLSTNNLDLPYSLPAPAYLARVQLKDIWDPRALCVVHRNLVAALPQKVSLDKLDQAACDPARFLADHYAREIHAAGTRLAAARGQAWSPAGAGGARYWASGGKPGHWPGCILRAVNHRSQQLLAEYGIDATAFIGAAAGIVVDRRPLPAQATPLATVSCRLRICLAGGPTD